MPEDLHSDIFVSDRPLTWAEVSIVHKARNGIYQKSGRLISLLTDFGRINPCYPDFQGESPDTIEYTGSGRRGNQKLDAANRALIDAIETGTTVPLFNKVDVNNWEYLGHWQVSGKKYIYDQTQKRMLWKFRLEKEADGKLREI